MCVGTAAAVVTTWGEGVLEGVRTPDDLVVVDQVVWILIGLINEVDGDLLLGVCKRTKISVFAGEGVCSIGLTKLGLVAAGMIELFDLIVGLAAVAIGLDAGDMRVGLKVGPAFILIIVIVETDLALVGF